jgi:methylmalonyl-CoA mutase cobalamin-binding subunit
VSEATPKMELSVQAITEAFQILSDELGKRGVTGELCVFGGIVMVLAFKTRLSAKDVGAIFQPTTPIRDIVVDIADQKMAVGLAQRQR